MEKQELLNRLSNIPNGRMFKISWKKELPTYKGVMISKNNPEKDMFKIDLLNMLQDNKH